MWQQPFLDLKRELSPIPTSVEKKLTALPNIKAVLWDVYGTLIISASGDVGSADSNPQATAFVESHQAMKLSLSVSGEEGFAVYQQTICDHQQRRRNEGVEYPEVDIVAVWREVHQRLEIHALTTEADFQRLAAEFEARSNPTGPMPNAEEILDFCRTRGLALGIVSNAQFFTPALFEIYLGRSLAELGFASQLNMFSYQHFQAKPGTYLFERVAEVLAKQDIQRSEVLYLGNDRCNDVWPAQRVGFKTGLFAGDQRSYRPRIDDAKLHGVESDILLTELIDLQQVLT